MGDRRAHEPSELTLKVRRVPCDWRCRRGCPGSHVLLAVPSCPGWSFPAPTPSLLALGVERAFAEATIAAYARLRGVLYDLAETEEEIPAEAYARGRRHPAEPAPAPAVDEVELRRRRNHPNTHAPEEWTELSDGALLSPKGRRYGPETLVASRVRARRQL